MKILGELFNHGRAPGQELRQRLILLILMPAVHRTSRQIAYGFPSLTRDDVGQQLLTSILQILQSKPLLKQQSHFAFTITRLMRRHSFRWAVREARLAPTQKLATPIVAEAVVEDGTGFETSIHLREFLRGCLYDGQLTEAEHELLMLFKIQGVSVEVLAAREGLSEIAFRHRMQRVLDKLRRIAQSPSLAGKATCSVGRDNWVVPASGTENFRGLTQTTLFSSVRRSVSCFPGRLGKRKKFSPASKPGPPGDADAPCHRSSCFLVFRQRRRRTTGASAFNSPSRPARTLNSSDSFWRIPVCPIHGPRNLAPQRRMSIQRTSPRRAYVCLLSRSCRRSFRPGWRRPWTQATQALQTAFTGPIATGLALVAIVVGGLMFAFGEGGAKRTLAGVVFGVGMAVGAVNFMAWLFP